MKVIRSFYILYVFIFLASCKKSDQIDITTLQTHHNIAIPLVSAEIEVADMLAGGVDTIINTGSSGDLFLVYSTDPVNFSTSDLVGAIPDQNISSQVAPFSSLPSPVPLNLDTNYGDTIINQFSMPVNGATPELTSIDFSQGIFNVSITNNFSHNITLTFTIPSLVGGPNGTFTSILPVTANNSAITQENLSNYVLDLSLGSQGYNELIVYLNVEIDANGSNISSTDQIDISFDMVNMDFDLIEGDLKNIKIALDPLEIDLNIFENSESAVNFQLTNPAINFNISNSFGFSPYMGMDTMYYEDLSGVKIDDIKYDSTGSNQQPAPFYFPAIGQPITPGNPVSSVISINSSNSSIDQLINDVPKKLLCKPFVEINPDTTSTNSNSISKNSAVTVASEVMLPLEGYAGGWKMGDTIPFDFEVDNLFSSNTNVDTAQIKFTTVNGWPVDVSFTLELLDSAQITLTSIANSEIILESGLLDNNGRVITPSTKNTVLKCDNECVDKLNQTKYVIILVEANTQDYNNQQAVKIYDDYKLGLTMALLVSGRML